MKEAGGLKFPDKLKLVLMQPCEGLQRLRVVTWWRWLIIGAQEDVFNLYLRLFFLIILSLGVISILTYHISARTSQFVPLFVVPWHDSWYKSQPRPGLDESVGKTGTVILMILVVVVLVTVFVIMKNLTSAAQRKREVEKVSKNSINILIINDDKQQKHCTVYTDVKM